MKIRYVLMCMYISCAYFFVDCLIDLENFAQDFVLSAQQIKLIDYPYAFNPSIIRWKERLLLCFRVIPDAQQSFTSWLGLVWVDDNFDPISKPQQLQLRDPLSSVPPRMEDGRLIMAGDRLYLVYSDNEDELISKGGFRVYIAELEEVDGIFNVRHKEKLSIFEGNNELIREKNWTPFVYKDQLLLAYSLAPHLVFAPIPMTNSCTTISSWPTLTTWKWGELRGGTQALFQGDHYLGFFHSCMAMESVHCPKKARHYFMGAYLFSPEPPFEITHMSADPIIGKNFYHGVTYKPYWGTIQAIFPGGFVSDNEYIWIVFGRQDHEMWVTKLDKKKLYESLIPCDVTPNEEPNKYYTLDHADSEASVLDAW